jgi:hypothetical protein
MSFGHFLILPSPTPCSRPRLKALKSHAAPIMVNKWLKFPNRARKNRKSWAVSRAMRGYPLSGHGPARKSRNLPLPHVPKGLRLLGGNCLRLSPSPVLRSASEAGWERVRNAGVRALCPTCRRLQISQRKGPSSALSGTPDRVRGRLFSHPASLALRRTGEGNNLIVGPRMCAYDSPRDEEKWWPSLHIKLITH